MMVSCVHVYEVGRNAESALQSIFFFFFFFLG